MAAATDIQTVNIIVNGIELAVPKGELVVEAVKRLGLEIPIFCYHPRLKPVGMCRMCLVETGMKNPQDGTIRMMPKPAAACTLPVSEGLVINTESDALKKDRKGVLEFLLINHPLDCPICDRGGECPLQNNTLFYGPATSRFIEQKRHNVKAYPLSDYVTLDLERCIQCARCIRFTEEISGDSQLAFRFRGNKTHPITFNETKFTSKFSGNVIEICPVGALTNRKYRFRARPWDLQTSEAVCLNCSNGCNIWFDHRAGKVVRINARTNEAINEEWTCDKGKFGHDYYNDEKRLETPFARTGDELQKADYATVYAKLLEAFHGDNTGMILGDSLSNETYITAQNFFTGQLGSHNIDYRFSANQAKGASTVDNSIASLELAKTTLVFGTHLADDLPIVFLRVRKGWFNQGTQVILATDRSDEVSEFAAHTLVYKPGTEATIAKAFAGQVSVADAAAKCGISEPELQAAITAAAGATVITTTSLNHEAAEVLKALDGNFNAYPTGANERGAQLALACDGLSALEQLKKAANGELSALWVVGVDLFSVGLPREEVIRALENVDFLAVQDSRRTETFYYASVALPMTLPAEQDGSYTNCEGTTQQMKAIIPPVGQAKPAWRVFEELSIRVNPRMPFSQASEILASAPAFA
jgi:NADH-quinone oxidoreductase subunit G